MIAATALWPSTRIYVSMAPEHWFQLYSNPTDQSIITALDRSTHNSVTKDVLEVKTLLLQLRRLLHQVQQLHRYNNTQLYSSHSHILALAGFIWFGYIWVHKKSWIRIPDPALFFLLFLLGEKSSALKLSNGRKNLFSSVVPAVLFGLNFLI